MATIRINTQEFVCTVSYKEEICGDESAFDETFVISGNRHFHATEEAEWYVKAKEILTDLDCFLTYEDWCDEYSSLTQEQQKGIKELYDKCRCTDDIIVPVLNLLYPSRHHVEYTMTGYSQSDWQNVIYDANAVSKDTVDELESFYMGKFAEVIYEEENQVAYLTDDALWEAERNGTVEQLVRGLFQIDGSEPVEIYKSNGVITTIRWERIN